MAFATASSAANRKPYDNTQTAAPPKHKRDRVNRQGKPEPPARARLPGACQAPACQTPQHMPGPQRARTKTGLWSVSRTEHRASEC